MELDQQADDAGEQHIFHQLGIDQDLLSIPEKCTSQLRSTAAFVSAEAGSISAAAKGKRKALEPSQENLDGNSLEPSQKKVHISISLDPSMGSHSTPMLGAEDIVDSKTIDREVKPL